MKKREAYILAGLGIAIIVTIIVAALLINGQYQQDLQYFQMAATQRALQGR